MMAGSMKPEPAIDESRPNRPAPAIGGRYAIYALLVLFVVMVLNFMDRQILAILVEDIRKHLGIPDARIGFLYGTAFAVFFAVFGIPLARLADLWDRRLLIALGISLWSLMTVLSGLATGFGLLAAARIGVGIGEASSGPASHSLISDYFSPERRATAIAIYSSGIYVGAGLGVLLGGFIVEAWNQAFPAGDTPFGLAGWQVAFLVAGVPGLLIALWVRTLREPLRGQSEGLAETSPRDGALRAFVGELRSIVPPFPLLELLRAGRARALWIHLGVLLGLGALAVLLSRTLGNPEQWIALSVGGYAAFSWAQSLARRDPPAFQMIFHTPSLRYLPVAIGCLGFTGFGIGFWAPAFFLRTHGIGEAQVGAVVGPIAAVAGLAGVTLGGLISDGWRRRSPNGRLALALVSALLAVPFGLAALSTANLQLAYLLSFLFFLTGSLYISPGVTTVMDLVLPRMRATASAAYLVVVIFLGLALGPYAVGRLSEALGDLALAMQLCLIANGIAAVMLIGAMRHLPGDERSRLARARSLGEPVPRNAL